MNHPKADSIESAATAAPTEPAIGPVASPASPLTIKRATLVAADAEDEGVQSSRLRHIESYVGFIVDGRYQIESIIAQGGMGVVYLARHRLIEKPVALKILRPELVHNREITSRFLTEAQAASAIGSDHIVDVTDYGELPDGATYIVMEYLDGYSLNQRMQREEGLLPVPLVLSIARQIAEALQQAHDANIVHRDLKPDNVLLITRGKHEDFVKVLDFGIAKVASSQNQTTTAGKIFGTPHYMSPEQGRGDELDQRTDIYSLGIMLYEMLCGQVPFDGENPLGILTQHMYVDAKPLPEVCPEGRVSLALQCVVARCLMKDPTARYGSMAELGADLNRLEQLEPPQALAYFKTSGNAPAYLLPALKAAPTAKASFIIPVVLAAAIAVGVVSISLSDQTPDEQVASEPITEPSNLVQPEPEPVALQEVMLVAEPIDAHVYRGKVDLGVIPLVLKLESGKTVRLTLKRPGYRDRSVVVDGSEPRIAIKMRRVAGAAVAPPPPTDAGAREARVVYLRHQAQDHDNADSDAGAATYAFGSEPLGTVESTPAGEMAFDEQAAGNYLTPGSDPASPSDTSSGARPPSNLTPVELPPENRTRFNPYNPPPGPPPAVDPPVDPSSPSAAAPEVSTSPIIPGPPPGPPPATEVDRGRVVE